MTAQEETKRRHLVFLAKLSFALLALLALVEAVFAAYVPYGPLDLLVPKGSPLAWIGAAALGMFWAVTLQGTIELFRGKRMTKLDVFNAPLPSRILKDGARVSLAAGVLEEISFRWMLFLLFLFVYAVVNVPFLTVGIMLDPLVHTLILTPLANVMTLGFLHDALYHDAGWHVGAAMLTANAFFRDGHKYQGLLGMANAWMMGMYFFWVMLTYGLFASILAHALYDVAVFSTMAAGSTARLRGWLPTCPEP